MLPRYRYLPTFIALGTKSADTTTTEVTILNICYFPSNYFKEYLRCLCEGCLELCRLSVVRTHLALLEIHRYKSVGLITTLHDFLLAWTLVVSGSRHCCLFYQYYIVHRSGVVASSLVFRTRFDFRAGQHVRKIPISRVTLSIHTTVL